jgi:hypothetical protein
VNVQGGGAAACVTTNAWPPIVTVALRAAPVLPATTMFTELVPVPLAGLTDTQADPLDAVHPHPVALAVTVTLPLPAADVNAWLVAERAIVQGGGAAACVTTNAWPPIVSVALRAAPVFSATTILTAPVPVPPAGLTETQAEPLDAVHAQLVALAVTVRLPLPAADVNV